MQIAAPCVVSLTWRLADAQGAEIDELTEPVEFFFGGDDLLAKVEEALAGHEVGDEMTLHLEPEPRDDGLVKFVGATPEETVWIVPVPEPVTVKQRARLATS